MTVLQIDLNKLEKNYHSLRKRLNPHSKMIGVIKANAYGGVSGPIAEKLVEMGIEALAVAYTEEGVQLRKLGIKIPSWFFTLKFKILGPSSTMILNLYYTANGVG